MCLYFFLFLFRNGTDWTASGSGSAQCQGGCSVDLGPGDYNSTVGFKYALCSNNKGKIKEIGLWCSDGGDTGSVMQITKTCSNEGGTSDVDCGIAVSEYKSMFYDNFASQQDFDNLGTNPPSTASYSLNLWVK